MFSNLTEKLIFLLFQNQHLRTDHTLYYDLKKLQMFKNNIYVRYIQ